jgi:hypothetical protein
MKDYRFDELSKELAATPLSRRRALKLLLAGQGQGYCPLWPRLARTLRASVGK